MSTTSLASSPSESHWVVQKFGGTSVGKFPVEIAENIVKVWSKTNNVAVVCSARSTQTKSEGTTTRLLLASDLAQDDEDFDSVLKLIEEDHVNNANLNIKSSDLKKKLISDSIHEVNEIRKLLNACKIIGEISPKSQDSIMACGEKLSCLFMAALLNDIGIKSSYINLSNIVSEMPDIWSNDNNKNESALDPIFYKLLAKAIRDKIDELPAKTVPVITGFFGSVPGGLLASVGRGYTDLCAAICAVGLDADELQIWKEVDGIFTADPRKVPTARLLNTVTPDEAAELTYYGSEVIHPFTMEQVINARIPIRIKNVMNPTGEGTIIYPDNIAKRGDESPAHPPVAPQRIPSMFFKPIMKIPTAVTNKNDIAVISVHSNKKTLSHGFLASVFHVLDKHRIVVDLISTSEIHVSLAVPYTKEKRKALSSVVEDLKKWGLVEVTYDLSIVSLVGIHMKQLIGIAGAMFKTLADEKINIEMISQGANEINISCVISKDNVLRALVSLHESLISKPFNAAARQSAVPRSHAEHLENERTMSRLSLDL